MIKKFARDMKLYVLCLILIGSLSLECLVIPVNSERDPNTLVGRPQQAHTRQNRPVSNNTRACTVDRCKDIWSSFEENDFDTNEYKFNFTVPDSMNMLKTYKLDEYQILELKLSINDMLNIRESMNDALKLLWLIYKDKERALCEEICAQSN